MLTTDHSDTVAREVFGLGATVEKLNEWLADPAYRPCLRDELPAILEAAAGLNLLCTQIADVFWPLKAAE